MDAVHSVGGQAHHFVNEGHFGEAALKVRAAGVQLLQPRTRPRLLQTAPARSAQVVLRVKVRLLSVHLVLSQKHNFSWNLIN